MSRYFGSDTALEQLSWLLKGCGINMPIGLVDDIDLSIMSALNFNYFNSVCPIVDPENNQSGVLFQRFATCIENIKHEFQYPQYYNGLMGLLLLFSNDETFNLKEQIWIQQIFEETKELVITGYEDYGNFTIQSLNNLLSTLREMADIFRTVHGDRPFERFKVITEINEEECFEDIEGIKTQIKPIDCSKSSNIKDSFQCKILDFCQTMPLADKLDCDKRSNDIFSKFEMFFGSVTSGWVVTTCIGKISNTVILLYNIKEPMILILYFLL